MGQHPAKSNSIFTNQFLKNLEQSTPLKLSAQVPYQIHEIFSHSPQHHHNILDTIRVKKNYNSPYIIKILDSHTVQSHSFCSNIIKTFVIVEKPQSLQISIQKGKSYFTQHELWLILFSCCSGVQFLINNGVSLSRITKNTIFIDCEGCVKIGDPELSESFISGIGASETQILNDLGGIIKEISAANYSQYSNSLKLTINNCVQGRTSFDQIISNFNSECMSESSHDSSPSFSLSSFKLLSKKVNLNSEKTCRTMKNSAKKQQNFQHQCRLNTSYSYRSHYSQDQKEKSFKGKKKLKSSAAKKIQDKENFLFLTNNNELKGGNDLALFTFKDPLKQIEKDLNQEKNIKNEEINHKFPKKALFKHKNKVDKNFEKDSEIEGNEKKKDHLVSFQVDQETLVCQVEKDKSSYMWELLNTKRTSEISMNENV